MMLAPVVLFVYNRLDHTQHVVETLSRNHLAKESELYVFSDAAKNENASEKVEAVRSFIQEETWHEGFKNVTIVEAQKNKGLANSVIDGVSKIIEQYGRVIVVEDDLVLSPFFLDYMNGALDFYENEENIWSISGYSFPMKSMKHYPHDVFYSYRGCSWGWATWSDRWKTVDWDVKDYRKASGDSEWIRRFNRGGGDLFGMLQAQMEGKIDSWAIRWCFAQCNQEKYTIYPKYSYLGNDGCDGSGTNCGYEDSTSSAIEREAFQCRYEKLQLDKKVVREFYLYYTDTLKKKIVRNIKKIAGKIRSKKA